MNHTPFHTDEPTLLVAMVGPRAGYLQIAPRVVTSEHAEVPPLLFQACQTWASFLQTQASVAKVYWLQWSEVVTHLHWHLYPRWVEDPLKGVEAFNARHDLTAQRPWDLHWQMALYQWAERYSVTILDPEGVLSAPETFVQEAP
ncbi:MAG: hypothetical protein HEQ32_02120 [Vampirovibrio sp.]